jgi:hypothetical protein
MYMMEIDSRKEARVWQRLQAEKQEGKNQSHGENLQALVMEQLQLSAVYSHLARVCPGRDGAVFMRLAREAKIQALCLKGILKLITGQNPSVAATPPQSSLSEAMLRRCYGQELRLLREYESRCTDTEYGPVFDRMAGRNREHCAALMELIGNQKG